MHYFPVASRKQRRPSVGENLYWVRIARIQAGLPHVGKEPGRFVDDSDGSELITHAYVLSIPYKHIFWKCLKANCGVLTAVLCRFSADWHVCRFRHHDRQVAGWDHSAYPAVQSHHRQDKVSHSTLILRNIHIHTDWQLPFRLIMMDYLRQSQNRGKHQVKQHFLWSVDGSRDCTWILGLSTNALTYENHCFMIINRLY